MLETSVEGTSLMPGFDLIASAFNGANAAFIADLYARWAAAIRRLGGCKLCRSCFRR